MFGTLRNKFQSVQEGISASIRGLSVAESSKPKKLTNIRNVNYNAGADVLHHFQMRWNELHELAEENAEKAQQADALIASIHDQLEYEWNNVTQLNNTLAAIPKINNDIQNLMDQIGTLQELFEEVETSLFQLQDLNETLDLQSRQLDHRFQLALYKEKKLSELDSTRAKLAGKHSEKVLQHELKQQQILKERQETFEEAFKKELEEYKTTGIIPRTFQKGPSLEEVDLDVADSSDLDEFLKS
ncbi:dysbindin protein homolog isoform X2 [Cephus cinctus]|uniref:Dysbindin protein homolog isoform X2 n=1 Tax=Cephus cinctus TaxID=211228 RepID=A0AAJ7FNN1_CEPCN|nr:dysbindin protein homolog isoform X2 [Cephus cinctus]